MQFFQRGITGLSTKILMIIIAVTFVLWGVGTTTDMLRTDGGEWALKVGDVTFSPHEWKHLMDRATAAGGDKDRTLLKQAVIEDMVKSAVLLQEAQRLELLVSDDMVKNEIANMPAFRDQSGKFDKDAFDRTIKNSGLSEIAFRGKVKEQMMRTQFVEFFYSSSSVIAPQFVNFTLKSMYGERVMKLFKLSTKAVDSSSIQTPTDIQLQDEIVAHKELFEIPETREISYAIIDASSLADKPIISKEEVENEYNNNKETIYKEPEKRTLKQIVVSTYEEAKSLVADVKTGKKDFNKLLTEHSKTQSAPTELKEVTVSGFDDQVARIVFNLTKGSISDPLQTPLGWHIFEVVEIYPGHTKMLDEVEGEINKQLQAEKTFELVSKMVEGINIEVENDKDWSGIVAQYGLKAKDMTLEANQNPTTILDPALRSGDFLKPVFAVEKLSPAMPIGDTGSFVIFNVSKIIPSSLPELIAIKDKVMTLWQQEQLRLKLFALADDIRDDVADPANDKMEISNKYKDLIDQNKLAISERSLSYVKPMPSDIPQAMIDEVLESDVGDFTSPYTQDGDGNYYFALLERIDLIPDNVLDELRNRFSGNIARMYQEMLFNEYIRSVHKKYKVDVNSQFVK